MSLFYKSLTYKESVEFQKRKRKFKAGKPCAICGKTLELENMMVAHLIPACELTDKKALFNEANWEVRCIQCEQKLHHEEQLRQNAKVEQKTDLKLEYLRDDRKRKIIRQKAYRNFRSAQAEVRMRKLSGHKRRRRVHKHQKDDYYNDFGKGGWE